MSWSNRKLDSWYVETEAGDWLILCKRCAKNMKQAGKVLEPARNASLREEAKKRTARCAKCGCQRYQ